MARQRIRVFSERGAGCDHLRLHLKAPKNFNAFGGSLGGPVALPKLGWLKDRTFFFLDYEGNRKTQSYPEELLVPTAAERAGDLSDLVNAPGQGAPVNNPFTGHGGMPTTPSRRISPVAQTLLSYYPLPNANGTAITTRRWRRFRRTPTAGICVWTKPSPRSRASTHASAGRIWISAKAEAG